MKIDATELIFGVDFDGTCVTPRFPKLGVDIGAAIVLKALQMKGHKIMLWTLRGHTCYDFTMKPLEKSLLDDVYSWEKRNQFKFDYYNYSPGNLSDTKAEWTDSPKQFAHFYIDDMSLGCPLTLYGKEEAVDWVLVVKWLNSELKIFSDREAVNLIFMIKLEIEKNMKHYEKMQVF